LNAIAAQEILQVVFGDQSFTTDLDDRDLAIADQLIGFRFKSLDGLSDMVGASVLLPFAIS
jgi:hypothetical protein